MWCPSIALERKLTKNRDNLDNLGKRLSRLEQQLAAFCYYR